MESRTLLFPHLPWEICVGVCPRSIGIRNSTAAVPSYHDSMKDNLLHLLCTWYWLCDAQDCAKEQSPFLSFLPVNIVFVDCF